jgi:hypothetical protein
MACLRDYGYLNLFKSIHSRRIPTFFKGDTQARALGSHGSLHALTNAEHLSDHRYWHLSGAALTIWLTRNWAPTELIARAIELESPTATSVVPR